MNPTSEYSPMPTAKFPTVNAVLDYLRAPSPEEAVSSSTASVPKSNTKAKKTKKEEEPEISASNGQVLSSGRVRYGPITVNPRKKPSKTLFTGRRSKYEPLTGDEEEKRRLRRERNRVAATKCREKREGVLSKLETVLANECALHDRLLNDISQLKQRQQYLQSVLDGRLPHGPLPQINPTTSPQPPMSTMAYANPHFLANTVDSPATLPPPPPYEQPLVNNVPTLTNSAFESDPSSYFDPHPPQSQILDVTMNSSIERLINSLQSPSGLVDGNNNNFSGLFNSAYGTSTCAQQHSSSSEDDSLPSTRKNRCVF